MSFSGARRRPRIGNRIKDTVSEQQKIYSLFRRSDTPIQTQVAFAASVGADPSSGQSDSQNLQTSGGSMSGPYADFPVIAILSNHRLDVSQATGAYAKYILVLGDGTPDYAKFIDGAAFSGQELDFQGTNQTVIELKSATLPDITNIVGIGGNIVQVTVADTTGILNGDEVNITGTSNFDKDSAIVTNITATTFDYDLGSSASLTPEATGIVEDGNILSDDGNSILLDGTVSLLGVPIATLKFDPTAPFGGWRNKSRNGTGGVGNVPDGTAQFQHLEWDGSAWVNQIALSFGSTSAIGAFLRFPNNFSALGWRNVGNTDDVVLFLDTNDEVILDEADAFEIRNSRTGASGIANFVSFRNDASPTTGDELGSLRFDGKDDAGETTQYARMIAGIADVADLSEDGLLQFEVAIAGSLTPFIRLNDSNLGNVHFLKDATFGTNPADDGRVNFANNVVGTSWRNFANTGNVSIKVDANNDLILSEVDQLKIENTTTGASGIANFVSFRNDASPTAGDELGSLRFDGKDSGGDTIQYVRFLAGIADETDLSEDGQALIQMAEAGLLVNYLSFNLINSGTVGVLKDLDMNNNKIADINPTTITDLTTVTGASGDFLMMVDATDGLMKKVNAVDFIGAGSQTPWVSNIDADNFDLFDLDDLTFAGVGSLLNMNGGDITGFDVLQANADTSTLNMVGGDIDCGDGDILQTGDIRLGTGSKIKADQLTEIGIQVDNASSSSGTLGMLAIPSGALPASKTKANMDAALGDHEGAMGWDTGLLLRLWVRNSNGNWYGFDFDASVTS